MRRRNFTLNNLNYMLISRNLRQVNNSYLLNSSNIKMKFESIINQLKNLIHLLVNSNNNQEFLNKHHNMLTLLQGTRETYLHLYAHSPSLRIISRLSNRLMICLYLKRTRMILVLIVSASLVAEIVILIKLESELYRAAYLSEYN